MSKAEFDSIDDIYIRVSGIVDESIVDGKGLRFVLFTQGCPHLCEGCHNPQTHDMRGGHLMSVSDIIKRFKESGLSSITLSGGEPFMQPKELYYVAKYVKEMGGNVISYTGFLHEDLQKIPDAELLLSQIDLLVDGKFMLDQKTMDIPFVGSKNQRLIPLTKTGETLL